MLVEIKNDFKEMDMICNKIDSFCQEQNIVDEKHHNIALIVDELVTNIISYAYPGGGEHTFSLTIEKCDNRVCICLTDGGIPFNPLSCPSPDVDSPLDERPIGGLGISLVKQLSETIEYARVEDKNQLSIKVLM
ncbi:MAG: ATP-binding protein [Holosporaceae bacterium]|jgi:anti-sigma regulatory factor (Ser/Thr protein kinase)|nr:ATP-binding protein [Holosporaceae bacterium]